MNTQIPGNTMGMGQMGQIGMASTLGSAFRTGNPMIDMFVMMIVMTMVTKLVGSVDQIIILTTKYFYIIVGWVMTQGKNLHQTTVVTIERNLDKDEYTANNKIIIDAILSQARAGSTYKLENKSVKDRYSNDYTREIDRQLFLQIDEGFTDEDIHIKYETITKTVKQAVKDSKGNSIDNAINDIIIPLKDVMTLSSSTKSLDEIQEYIKRKRDQYIHDTCSHDDVINIYSPIIYGETHVEFRVLKFKSGKSMDSWFIPNHAQIEHVIDNFINREGIYKLPSTQWKLGFLLHGEPGCGKSSFIKVLANKLHRHVFPISLNEITSAESFKRLFHNDYVMSRDGPERQYIPIDKRIIVFEEIDTAGEIVMDRKKLREMNKNEPSVFASEFGKYSFYKNFHSSSKYEKKKKNSKYSKFAKLKKKNALERKRIETLLRNKVYEKGIEILGDKKYSDFDDAARIEYDTKINNYRDYLKATDEFKILLEDESDVEEEDSEDSEDEDSLWDKSFKPKHITLGDILTILDGIHELHGLVYVMTTNHRKYLDPALIRPGRITCEIELKRMQSPEIQRMLNYYYYIDNNCHDETTSIPTKEKQIIDIARVLSGRCKPSRIEVLCQQNSLEEFFKRLPSLDREFASLIN